MTVEELIKMLQQQDPKAIVCLEDEDYNLGECSNILHEDEAYYKEGGLLFYKPTIDYDVVELANTNSECGLRKLNYYKAIQRREVKKIVVINR